VDDQIVCFPSSPPPLLGSAHSLMEAAEAWLEGRPAWFRRLPPVLAAEYDRETRRTRSRGTGFILLIGSAIGLMFYPTLYSALPDVRAAVTWLYLGGAVPFSFAIAMLLLLNPPPLLREWMLALPSLANAGVLTWLFIRTRVDATEMYVAGIILLMLFAAVTAQLRFNVAAWVIGGIVAMDGVAMQAVHVDTPSFRESLFLINVVCGGYVLIANHRMGADQQRAFVLGLRERLRRQDLFARNQELDELARRDALTGLANRRAYDSWLLNSWRQARGSGGVLGLVAIDVDRFKGYNDFYGHPAGDTCLQAIARCLRDQLRGTSDHVARLGGEEFAVLLPGLGAELCGDVAERLREAVRALELPHLGNGREAVVTISCGAASLPALEQLSPRDLAAAADAALYQAKQNGRDRVCLADGLPPFGTGSVANGADGQPTGRTPAGRA
jgi:diguanylate cyclase (GGDEF)-like protein